MDELARALGMDPFELRRKNIVRPGDAIESLWEEPSDVEIGSYGLDQCLDLVAAPWRAATASPAPDGDDWLEGRASPRHARHRAADRAPLRGPDAAC